MKSYIKHPMLNWSVRDLRRRPADACVLSLAIMILMVAIAAPMLMTRALRTTMSGVLDASPSLIVRRSGISGLAFIPGGQAIGGFRSVPGVVRAYGRMRGLANVGARDVTVIGWDESLGDRGVQAPERGRAILGSGFEDLVEGGVVRAVHGRECEWKIGGDLPRDAGTPSWHVLLVHPEDFRALFQLPAGGFTEIAVDVYHVAEEQAIIPDLIQQAPWPVNIKTRAQLKEETVAEYAGRGGFVNLTLLPAVLALMFIVAAVVRERVGRWSEVGLLKASGWTSRDIIKFQMVRGAVFGLPSILVGLAGACLLVFHSSLASAMTRFMGLDDRLAHMALLTDGAGIVLIQASLLVVIPYFSAILWPALRGVTIDVMDLIGKAE
jgi:hypothetical protein